MMTKFNNYHVVKVGDISKKKLIKAAKGGSVNLSRDELTGNNTMVLHPENAKKVIQAQKTNKGTRLTIAPGEIANDLDYHSTIQGGSIWSDLKSGLSSLWNTIGKPIASAALDGIATAGQSAMNGFVPGVGDVVAPALRQGVKNLAGVGVSGRGKLIKGSQEAKDHMNKLRAIRQSKARGGSFLL